MVATSTSQANKFFDQQYYLDNNPDVADAVNQGILSPFGHFIGFGISENRAPSQSFNFFTEDSYLQSNPDVANAVQNGVFDSALDHFLSFGLNEERSGTGYNFFDSENYLNENNDVAQAVQNGVFDSALEHYLEFGFAEDRPGVQPPTPVEVGDVSQSESDTTFEFEVTNDSDEDLTLDYSVVGTGTNPTTPFDFAGDVNPSGQVNLTDGEGTVSFEIADDNENEGDETFQLVLSDPSSNTILGEATGTIEDDDDGNGGSGEVTDTLTTEQDDIEGTDDDDVFEAPIVQNELGAVTNTLESGDVVNGLEGNDTLNADLTLTTSGTVPVGPAISPNTNSVENVFLRAQSAAVDTGGQNSFSNIDAQNMNGVQQWWSENSRSYIQVEDIQTRPNETTIGMRDTDPGVSYGTFFDARFIEGDILPSNSSITISLKDLTNPDAELENITVNELSFVFQEEEFVLESQALADANTYDEFITAVREELGAEEALQNLQFTNQGDGEFELTDPNGGTFETGDITVSTPGNIDLRARQNIGQPIDIEEPTETDIVLDGVGSGSQGGALNVGAFSGDRGVEIFNVDVAADSHLSTANAGTGTGGFLGIFGGNPPAAALSSGSLRTGEQFLEQVNVEGEGDLSLGTSTLTGNPDNSTPGFTIPQPNSPNFPGSGVSTTIDDRLQNDGLLNVRVFDASGFENELKVGATIGDNAVSRYLDEAEEPVQFTYTLGDAGSNLSLALSNLVSTDDDFLLDINGGAEDDRINLSTAPNAQGNIISPFALQAVSIDGGEGTNTLETAASIGTNSQSTPEEFANIQKLELAGQPQQDNNGAFIGDSRVDADMANLPGVEELLVAHTGNDQFDVNSDIRNLESDTTITITGQNQTLGNNSNADQYIGTVDLEDAQATAQEVDLDNTARVDGQLIVDQLLITESTNGTSNVEELVLSSNGERDTSNIVRDIQAPAVSTINLVGTQALSAHVSVLATDNDQSLTIDGSALESNLTLALNGAELEEGADDEVVATSSDSDTLALYGDLLDGNNSTNPTVSEFETVQFGWLANSNFADKFGLDLDPDPNATQEPKISGNFSAGNTSGVETYVVGSLDGQFTLDNLSNGDSVVFGDESASDNQFVFANNNVTLSGSGGGTLDVATLEKVNGGNINTLNDFNIDNFATINLDLARPLNGAQLPPPDQDTKELSLNLQLDNIDPTAGGLTGLDSSGGTAIFDNGFEVDNTVRNLNITGGDADETDILVLNNVLPASLSTIDVSDYNGQFGTDANPITLANAVIEDPNTAGDYLSVNTDTRFVLGAEEDANIALTDPTGGAVGTNPGDGVDFNTIFEFSGKPASQDGGSPAVSWEIDNFIAESFNGADNDNFSILDLSDLGIGSFADLDFTNQGANVEITEEGGNSTWEIVLNGVQSGDLAPSENFTFA